MIVRKDVWSQTNLYIYIYIHNKIIWLLLNGWFEGAYWLSWHSSKQLVVDVHKYLTNPHHTGCHPWHRNQCKKNTSLKYPRDVITHEDQCCIVCSDPFPRRQIHHVTPCSNAKKKTYWFIQQSMIETTTKPTQDLKQTHTVDKIINNFINQTILKSRNEWVGDYVWYYVMFSLVSETAMLATHQDWSGDSGVS